MSPTIHEQTMFERGPQLQREGVRSALSNAALAQQCLLQLGAYRRDEPCDEASGLELFRRATVEGDPEAWEWVQRCFGEVVLAWLRRHRSRAAACRLESEENYVALAFERFWQATTANHQVEFNTLAAALQYLRASLNGAVLDTVRAYRRSSEVPLPEPGKAEEPGRDDVTCGDGVWEVLQTMLPDSRERRLAFLLYHCGLKPREIVRFCPQEWSDVQEIYRLRRNIMERFLRHADQLRWRLSEE
jgi:hypothetical protein